MPSGRPSKQREFLVKARKELVSGVLVGVAVPLEVLGVGAGVRHKGREVAWHPNLHDRALALQSALATERSRSRCPFADA